MDRARTGEVGFVVLFESGGTLGKPGIEAATWTPKMEFGTRSGSGKGAVTWTPRMESGSGSGRGAAIWKGSGGAVTGCGEEAAT